MFACTYRSLLAFLKDRIPRARLWVPKGNHVGLFVGVITTKSELNNGSLPQLVSLFCLKVNIFGGRALHEGRESVCLWGKI